MTMTFNYLSGIDNKQYYFYHHTSFNSMVCYLLFFESRVIWGTLEEKQNKNNSTDFYEYNFVSNYLVIVISLYYYCLWNKNFVAILLCLCTANL